MAGFEKQTPVGKAGLCVAETTQPPQSFITLSPGDFKEKIS